MPSVDGFPQVNIVETFLERGSVLKLSHGPIFSDFTNKSPVCVKQCMQQSKPKHDVPDRSVRQKDFAESSLQKHEIQSFVPKDPLLDTKWINKKPQEDTKPHNSVKRTKADINCEVEPQTEEQDPRNTNHKTTFTSKNRSERRQRRQRRKPNGVIQSKENSRSQRSRGKLPMEAKGTNTDLVPFFTLDPSWPCLMDTSSYSKSKAPVRKATTISLLQPASSSMVPKAHTKPEASKNDRPNSNSGHFQSKSDYDAELLKTLQRDVLQIKEEICETNSLVKDLEKRIKEASFRPSHNATVKKAKHQTTSLNKLGTRRLEPILPPCASPMQTQSLPLSPGMDLLPLNIGETSVISEFFGQNAYHLVQGPTLCNPSLDRKSQDTEKERTSSRISAQSGIDSFIASNPRLIDASYRDTLPRDEQDNETLKKTPESPTEDMTLSLHGDTSEINLTRVIHEKKKSLRDLALRKGICAIEIKYLTKLKQAKRQFLKEFNYHEDSALRGVHYSNSHSNSSSKDHVEKTVSKDQRCKSEHKVETIPHSKTKSTTPVNDKETSDASVICLEPGSGQSYEKETIFENEDNQKDDAQLIQKNAELAKSHREDVAPRTPTDDIERCTIPQENNTITAEHTESKETTITSPVEDSFSESLPHTVVETGSFNTAIECDLLYSKRKDPASQDTIDAESEESNADNMLLRVSDLSSDSSIEDDMGQVYFEQSELKTKQPESISSETSISQKDSIEPDQQMLLPQEVETRSEGSTDGSFTALSVPDEDEQIPPDVAEDTEQSTNLRKEGSQIAENDIERDFSSIDALSATLLPTSPVPSPIEKEVPCMAANKQLGPDNADFTNTENIFELVSEQEEINRPREDRMFDLVPDQEISEPTIDPQAQSSTENKAETYETVESLGDHSARNIEYIKDVCVISDGGLLHEEDTSSASSVVSESGINFCSSASSSSEPSVEVFENHDQDPPPVQRTLVPELTEPVNSVEDSDTRPTDQDKELDETVQECKAPGKPMLEELVFCELSSDDSEFEQDDPTVTGLAQLPTPSFTSTTVIDEAPALSRPTNGRSIADGIDELVGSCITRFYESGEMERFFKDSTQDPHSDLPLKALDLPEGVLLAEKPPNGIEQMLQDQINTDLLKSRKQIHLASQVTAGLNLPTKEELKTRVTASVHEVLKMQELQMEQINGHTTEDLESFFNDDLKFHELLVRHSSYIQDSIE